MPNAWNWSNFGFAELKQSLHLVSYTWPLQTYFLFYSPCWWCNLEYIKFFKRLKGHFFIPQQFHWLRTLQFKFWTTYSMWPSSFTLPSVAAGSTGVCESIFHLPCSCYMNITNTAFLTLHWVGPGAGSLISSQLWEFLWPYLLATGTWETEGVLLSWWSNWLFFLPFVFLN